MKRVILKIIVCCLVFFAALYISSSIMNQGNTDMTAEIRPASFPVVAMQDNGLRYNTLFGYAEELDGSLVRDSITPLDQNRTFSFIIDKYDNAIDKIAFEVRSVDGKRLVEQTEVTGYTETDEKISADITVKDLIDVGKEYNLILLVDCNGQTLRYYTRIIQSDGYAMKEKLSFVKDFHDKTFKKEEAGTLISYLESNAQGDNTTFSHVDIHSSFSQITWGSLNPQQVTDTLITVKDITKQTANVEVSCVVSTKEGRKTSYYDVLEHFRVRYTKDRMYLLEYERDMNQIFDPNQDVFANHKIMLGITSEDKIQMIESAGGSVIAFVNEDRLYCYNEVDNRVSYLFGFARDFDPRSLNNQHDLKILSVDETGNVTFMVYGYMNRGRYEGKVGVQIYEYNGMTNTIEEQVFIPYDKSVDLLKYNVEQLSFVNNNNTLYLYLDGSILAVNLYEENYSEIASNLQEGNFQVSDSNEMLVWQNTTNLYESTKLILMNLNSMKQKEVSTTEDKRILPLGFMENDLIYGIANGEDIVRDSTGAVTFPMNVVHIQNERGDILKSYSQEGIYVIGCEITDNMITLKRVEKSGEGYQEITNDQIMNNHLEESGYNTLETVATQNYEKIVQISLKTQIPDKSIKVMTPKEVLYEGSRVVNIDVQDELNRYYVYCKGDVKGVYTEPAKAINVAYDNAGSVLDKSGDYVWYKGRSTKNQIMAISGVAMDDDNSSLAVCLNTMLTFEGITKDSQRLIESGKTITEILSENLIDATVLDLGGSKLDAVLCYVDQDIPVLAMLNDGNAVLIVGYNELNVVLMDPKTGTVYKKGMNDSTSWFEENNNRFITYYRKEK